jgi:hypothetical protein
MTWSLVATGNAPNAEAEEELLDRLHEALFQSAAGTTSASISTQHYGRVDLNTAAEDPGTESED